MVLIMLDDNNRILAYEGRIEDQRWDFGETRMVVRGIGENDIERLGSSVDETEYISTEKSERLIPEFVLDRANESGLNGSLLDSHDSTGAARHELPADGAGAGEEVTY